MAKWNVNRSGPNWLMDSLGRLIGYQDKVGGEHLIPQTTGSWGDAEGQADIVASGSQSVSVSAGFAVTAADDGKTFTCTTALTITIPASLSPRPSFIVNPPASGNVSLDPTGAAELNGAGTTITRSRASNPAGVAVIPYAESDGYGVSGS